LIKSRDEWNGYIQVPEILKFTPKMFVEGMLNTIGTNSS